MRCNFEYLDDVVVAENRLSVVGKVGGSLSLPKMTSLLFEFQLIVVG